MMHRTRDEQAVKRNASVSDIAIRQNQDVAAIPHSRLGTGAYGFKRLSQALGGFVGSVHDCCAEAVLVQRGNRLEFRLRKDGRGSG